jgi:pyrroline-5-carboxylate reductase
MAIGMLNGQKIAVLGAGKMGETLIAGLLEAGAAGAEDIVATARHQERIDEIAARFGVSATLDNRAAIQGATIVLLCVKPQNARDVLRQIRADLTPEQMLVSIAASVSTKIIEEEIGKPVPVVRTMPNTPALIKQGMTALSPGRHATEEHVRRAEAIFAHVGRTIEIDEKYMDAVTGLSASGPAFIYIVIESLAEGGVKVGLPRSVATLLAAQAVLGAAAMVLETKAHPALLKDAVTTPAGCTIDGILKLEEGGLRVTLIKTIVEASKRAGELLDG